MNKSEFKISTPLREPRERKIAARTKKAKRVRTFLDLYQSGVRNRDAFLEAFRPDGGIPRDAADRAWLARELDQATAALRQEGRLALSFGGEMLYSANGLDLNDEQRELLRRYRDRQERKAQSFAASAKRIDDRLGQLSLFDEETNDVAL